MHSQPANSLKLLALNNRGDFLIFSRQQVHTLKLQYKILLSFLVIKIINQQFKTFLNSP